MNSQQNPQTLTTDEIAAVSGGEAAPTIEPKSGEMRTAQFALQEPNPGGAPTPGPLPNM